MLEVTLTVQLGLIGPVLSRATAIGDVGIDAPMARDRDGKYFLAFSLVRGRLRQAWEEIMDATDHQITFPIDDLLGPQGDSATDYEPQRGCLHCTDFQHVEGNNTSGELHRIRMDEDRGAADHGAMLVIESPFAPGQLVHFTGIMRYLARDKVEADLIQSQIAYGLRWMTNLGGERTVGFGRLVQVSLRAEHRSLAVVPLTTASASVETLPMTLRLLAPFCVSKRRIADNLFESETILSGGVLRGTLATTLKQLAGLPRNAVLDEHIGAPWHEIGAYFNHFRFTHAFPAPEQAHARPVIAPLSLVKDTHGAVYDVVLCEGPGLLGDPPRAPSFKVDWKTSDDVSQAFGWAEPERELRVRTALNRERRRAEDGQLFAYDMVVPHGVLWHGHIDLHRVPQAARAAVVEQLRSILRYGLHGIGKTKATAEVRLDIPVEPRYASDTRPLEDNLWLVTLQTPVLLCDPARLNEASGFPELFDAYDEAWREISDNTLQLVRFFASQSLAGGYQVLRFQPNKPYNPFLLTDAGSVFVLRASGDRAAAQASVAQWLHAGLRLPKWAQARYGHHWRTCPFLPEDGFGEVSINLPCHVENKPGEGVWHAI
jgi:hypothetical protein